MSCTIADEFRRLVRSPFDRTIGPDFDPRFDPRKKERERLESLTVGVAPRGLDVPEGTSTFNSNFLFTAWKK